MAPRMNALDGVRGVDHAMFFKRESNQGDDTVPIALPGDYRWRATPLNTLG
jgi:hypothetical protein